MNAIPTYNEVSSVDDELESALERCNQFQAEIVELRRRLNRAAICQRAALYERDLWRTRAIQAGAPPEELISKGEQRLLDFYRKYVRRKRKAA